MLEKNVLHRPEGAWGTNPFVDQRGVLDFEFGKNFFKFLQAERAEFFQGWMKAFNLTGVLPPKKFTKLRNRLWDYDDCIELEDLSDPVGESLMGEPYECPTPSAMAYDLFKALRVWEWFDGSYLDKWERLQFCDDSFPRNPGRRLLLVSRRLGWDLEDELKARFGILLSLRPTREEWSQR